MIDTPHIERNVFAQMSEDHLSLGVTIENAVCDHAQSMETDTNSEGQGRTNQPLPVFPELLEDNTGGVTGMQVQRNVEICERFPENVPFWLVVEDVVLAISTRSLGIVHKSALESVLDHSPPQFFCSLFRIVHRKCAAHRVLIYIGFPEAEPLELTRTHPTCQGRA